MFHNGSIVPQVVFDKCQQKVYVKMVSTLNLEEKFIRVRRTFCFYLDIQDHGLARSLSRRIQDMGLQQEVFLTPRVTHVVSGGSGRAACARRAERPGRRADAMLQRVRALQPAPAPRAHAYVTLTVQKAISLLDKLYDTFFTAPRKAHVRFFTKHFIKIEFLDKVCRPVFKEFDEWPEISLEPDPPREKKEKKESPENRTANINQTPLNTASQKMTRKSRPRIKEKEEKEQKAGYCEMCHAEYADATLHRRSPHHVAFVRDHTNFLALDSLISSGADVTSFLDKTAGINGERRSLRKICNGDAEPKTKRSKRSQSPDSAVNGQSPRQNGGLDEERRHNTRCAKRNDQHPEDRQYYKVVGVSTKLRSSGGFATKRKDSPPPCNGTKPLVVKFRKVRRSELSVLSDEAEQFMFPKRASSTSSTSSEDDEDEDDDKVVSAKRKSPPKPQPASPVVERRRLARPVYALKEESSEEDSWPEDKRRRKRRAPAIARRGRRAGLTRASSGIEKKEDEQVEETIPPTETVVPTAVAPKPEGEVSPLREEPVERCMKWEDGKLKYTPAVEQLEFAFESVPRSEPWYETFRRQDQDRVVVKNVPKYFALYSKAPKLPYEIGQLPPLKPNCCPLSDLVKRDEKPGPSRAYGTRGMKKQRIRKRTAAVQALEAHPRKSPREHASTLAILGSAGLLNRRKHADDTKSTASEDTVSDVHSTAKTEPVVSEAQEASERLQQFLSEVFEEAAEFDMSDETIVGDTPLLASTNAPDVSSLVSECEGCDIIRNEIQAGAAERARGRRGKFKKKNRTGWPNKRKVKKGSRTSSADEPKGAGGGGGGGGGSSAEPDEDTAPSTASDDATNDDDANLSEAERTLEPVKSGDEDDTLKDEAMDVDDDEPLRLDLKVVVRGDEPASPEKDEKRSSRSSLSDSEDREIRKKKRALQGLLLQPVVRVARVDPGVARRLRSGAGAGGGGRGPGARGRRGAGARARPRHR